MKPSHVSAYAGPLSRKTMSRGCSGSPTSFELGGRALFFCRSCGQEYWLKDSIWHGIHWIWQQDEAAFGPDRPRVARTKLQSVGLDLAVKQIGAIVASSSCEGATPMTPMNDLANQVGGVVRPLGGVRQ